MEYWLLRYVPFIILFYLHSSDVSCRVSGGGGGVRMGVGGGAYGHLGDRLNEIT